MDYRVKQNGKWVKRHRGGQKQWGSVVQKPLFSGVSVVEVILGVLAVLRFPCVDEGAG